MEEYETKIVSDFCHQLERSKQLFNGLRDLPQYGHRQWQSYFGKTFDVYTKLWKFQQQHRLVLEHRYGLRRWQIGEIASRIGQLYYHYYLRTSNTSYLHEAFAFYSAIRGRCYYSLQPSQPGGADRVELMVKKLRYCARFIVVCLLLKRLKLVRELVIEFGALVDQHDALAGGGENGALTSQAGGHRSDDRLEWRNVLCEIGAFLDAESVVTVQDIDSNQVVLSHRLETCSLNVEFDDRAAGELVAGGGHDSLSLQEILIVGNCASQVKFSELTVDMYRMLQTLERQQSEVVAGSCAPVSTSSSSSGVCVTPPGALTSPQYQQQQHDNNNKNNGCGGGGSKRENPHKYLLYRPTFCQLMAFLSSGFKELPSGGIMLLYMSSDGCFASPPSVATPSSGSELYHSGGVVTDASRHTVPADSQRPLLLLDTSDSCVDSWHQQQQHQRRQQQEAESGSQQLLVDPALNTNPHCVYPGDLLPFTRKPLLVIVDSDNATVFASLVSNAVPATGFRQPLVVLMSAPSLPPSLAGRRGSSSAPRSAAGGGCHWEAGGGGRLLTLFLHSPLLALCHVCNLASISVHTWEQSRRLLDSLLTETSRALSSCHTLPAAFARLMSDEFVRVLVLRFVVCRLVLQQHRAFAPATPAAAGTGASFVPQCAPALPDSYLMSQPTLTRCVRELFTQLDARHLLVTGQTNNRESGAAGPNADII